MYFTRWNSAPTLGIWSRSGFHGVHALPSSSTPAAFPPVPLNGFVVNPAAADAEPGPCAIARSALGKFWLDRTRWVWSSKTNRFDGVPVAAYAAGSNISIGLTLKIRPNTSFIARKAAARPPVPARNFRRLIPSFFDAESASSLIRASTRFCFSVCGHGMYSPFETIRVGTGEQNGSVSAGAQRASCSSLSQASSSRDPGGRFMLVLLVGG